MREAPSVRIIKKLTELGAKITAFDPIAMDNARKVLPEEVIFSKDAYSAVDNADGVAVLTEWNEFRQLDLVKIFKNLKEKVLFDGRNIYDPARVKQLGFVYYGVGRA